MVRMARSSRSSSLPTRVDEMLCAHMPILSRMIRAMGDGAAHFDAFLLLVKGCTYMHTISGEREMNESECDISILMR